MNRPQLRTYRRPKLDQGYVLLTGATGLLGQYLLNDLLTAGWRVAVVVRSSRRLNALERVEAIIQRWESERGELMSRPVVLEGDVSKNQLGLNAEDIRWCEDNVTSVIHNAAVVQFEAHDRTQEPWTTNCNGTQFAIDFAKEIGVEDFHYVSTAYVSGRREGVILEGEFDCGQAFRNAYEESKFQAEQLVRQQVPGATIYRPSIIAGDSQTGFTASYHGLMWYLRFLDVLVPQQPKDASGRFHTAINLPVQGSEPHNIVTVDFVSTAIASLFARRDARGKTFHLATEHPTTYRQIIEYCYDIFNSAGVTYGSEKPSQQPSGFAETFFEQSKVYHDYAVCNATFDLSNLKSFLPGLSSPKIDETMVRQFMEFGRADKWGKRREQKPEVPAETVDHLRQFISRLMLNENQILGVDVCGPGGGQWTARNQNGHIQLTRGIANDTSSILRLQSRHLRQDSNIPGSDYNGLRLELSRQFDEFTA
ncbi:MAG: SDR family oxidoreductase [Pirellulaceae bacterium]